MNTQMTRKSKKPALALGLLLAAKLFLSHLPAWAEPGTPQKIPGGRPLRKIERRAPIDSENGRFPFDADNGRLILHTGNNQHFSFEIRGADGIESMSEFRLPNTPLFSPDGKIRPVNVVDINPIEFKTPIGNANTGYFRVGMLKPLNQMPNSPNQNETPFGVQTLLGNGAFQNQWGNIRSVPYLSAEFEGKTIGAYGRKSYGPEGYYEIGLHTPEKESKNEDSQTRGLSISTIYAGIRKYRPVQEGHQNRTSVIFGARLGQENQTQMQLEGRLGARPGIFATFRIPFGWKKQNPQPEIPKPRWNRKELAKTRGTTRENFRT